MSGNAHIDPAEPRDMDGGDAAALSASNFSSLVESVFIYGINYTPEPTGVGRYTGDIGAYLSRKGVRVTVVTAIPHYPGWAPRDGYANWYKAESISGVRVVRCPLLLKSKMRGIWRLVAPLSFAITSAPVAIWKILIMRPDVVVCVEPTLFSAPLALCCAKLVRARTILHVQDMEIDAAFAVGHLARGKVKRFAHWIESCVLRRFTSVVTISSGMCEMLVSKGVVPARLSVVRNWVDIDKIDPMKVSSWLREELAIAPEAFIALYAGNIGPKQALPLVLDVAAALSNRADIVFIVAGEGPDKNSLIRLYGHLPNVRFLPVQAEDRFCELLTSVDCHLMPQHNGTTDMMLPSKLGGMLASGKPCIVMADDHTELYRFLFGSAVLVPPGNSEKLADAILSLASGSVSVNAQAQLKLVRDLDVKRCLEMFSDILLKGKSSPASDTQNSGGFCG